MRIKFGYTRKGEAYLASESEIREEITQENFFSKMKEVAVAFKNSRNRKQYAAQNIVRDVCADIQFKMYLPELAALAASAGWAVRTVKDAGIVISCNGFVTGWVWSSYSMRAYAPDPVERDYKKFGI